MSRSKIKQLLKKKELDEGKTTELEKHDFLAIMIGAASIFIPALIIFGIVFAALIWFITILFH